MRQLFHAKIKMKWPHLHAPESKAWEMCLLQHKLPMRQGFE